MTRTTCASSSSTHSPATTCRSSCPRWRAISTNTWRSRTRLSERPEPRSTSCGSATCTRWPTRVARSTSSSSWPSPATTSPRARPISTPTCPTRFAAAASDDRSPPRSSCRRQNWNVDCHLMQATRPEGKSVYLAFGAGDIVPMRLDAGVTVDKRQPGAHGRVFLLDHRPALRLRADLHDRQRPLLSSASRRIGGVVKYTSLLDQRHGGDRRVSRWVRAYRSAFPRTSTSSARPARHSRPSPILDSSTPNSTDTGAFANQDAQGNVIAQQFQVIPYNNLVYLDSRRVTNVAALATIGGSALRRDC